MSCHVEVEQSKQYWANLRIAHTALVEEHSKLYLHVFVCVHV